MIRVFQGSHYVHTVFDIGVNADRRSVHHIFERVDTLVAFRGRPRFRPDPAIVRRQIRELLKAQLPVAGR